MGTADWLSEDEGESLLSVARNAIKNRLNNVEQPQINWKDLPEKFQEHLGTFVTITIDGNLRGCIGHIIPREALIEVGNDHRLADEVPLAAMLQAVESRPGGSGLRPGA